MKILLTFCMRPVAMRQECAEQCTPGNNNVYIYMKNRNSTH